jgi:hypothetical protein
LTIPTGGSVLPSSSLNNGTMLSDVESEDELTPTIGVPTASTNTGLRQMTLGFLIPVVKSPDALEPATASSGLLTTRPLETNRVLRRQPSLPLRPLLLGTSSVAVPLIQSSSTKVPIGSRRKNGGLPSNPRRPVISGPSLSLQDGMGDQAPGAFERPRPPPLVFVADKPKA